jgi:hypothetical protein
VLAAVGTVYIRAKNNPALRTAGAAVTTHQQLTFTGKEVTPALSPNRGRIAFVSKESPHRKLVVRDVAGGRRVEFFSAPEIEGLRWDRTVPN